MHLDTGLEDEPEQLAMQLARMQATDIHAEHAAFVKVRPEDAALLGGRHCMSLNAERPAEYIGIACKRFVICGGGCASKAPGHRQVAGNSFVSDESLQVFPGGLRFCENRSGALLAEFRGKLPVARTQVAARDAAVPGGGALARTHAIEDLHRPAGTRQGQRSA